MKTQPEKTVHIRVKFPDRTAARPVLEDLGRDPALAVNVVRGRITREEASLDLEVSGRANQVDLFVRLSATLGASVGALPAGVA